MGDRFTAAAAGHVLVGRLTDQVCLGKRLAGAPGGAIPAAPGPAGYEKVNALDVRRPGRHAQGQRHYCENDQTAKNPTRRRCSGNQSHVGLPVVFSFAAPNTAGSPPITLNLNNSGDRQCD
jgi:hypothetical protein